MQKLIYLLFLLGLYGPNWAQKSDYRLKVEHYHAVLPPEDIYAHTDRSYYEPGETIWFSVYALNHEFSASKSDVLQVELINPLGELEQTYKLRLSNARAFGEFKLDQYAKEGGYRLRLSTLWQKNFGERQLIYEKKLWFSSKNDQICV